MSLIDRLRPAPKAAPSAQTTPAAPKATATPTAKPATSQGGSTFEPARKPLVVLNPTTSPTDAPSGAGGATATTAAGGATPTTAATSQENVRQDAARVEQAYARGGARAAAQELETLVAAHPNDPAYADALLREAEPTLRKISAELGDRVKNNRDDSGDNRITRDTLTSLANVADAAGADGRALLGRTLADGLPDQTDLNQFDDVLADLADDGKGHALSTAVLSALAGTKPEAAKELSELAVDQVESAREEYEKAAQARAEAEARLAQDLAALGNALTPEQINAYKAEYRERHKDIYDAEARAADKLAATLESNRSALETLATSGNGDAAKALYEGYNALAQSTNHADDAIRWVADISRAPAGENALFRAIDEATSGNLTEKLENELLATALPNAQAELLAKDYPGSPEDASKAAFEELKTLLDPLIAAKSLGQVPGQVGAFLEATRVAVYDGNWDRVARDLLDGWEGKSNFGKALAVASVAQSAYGAVNAFRDGNYPDAIKNSAAFASGALELTAGVLGTLGKASGMAHDVAKFAARAAPVLGLVVDGVQFIQDVQGIFDDPTNAGKWIQAFGTTVSLAGDALGFIPVAGTAADVLLGTLGTGIHALGSYISNVITGNREQRAIRDEQTSILAEVTGLSQEQARELVETGASDLERLRGLGLTPAQIQAMAKDDSIDLTSMETATLLKTAAGFGLQGQDVVDLLRAGQDNEDLEYLLITLLNSPEAMRGGASGDLTAFQDNLLLALEHSGEEGRAVAEILRRGSRVPDLTTWGPGYGILEGDGYIASGG